MVNKDLQHTYTDPPPSCCEKTSGDSSIERRTSCTRNHTPTIDNVWHYVAPGISDSRFKPYVPLELRQREYGSWPVHPHSSILISSSGLFPRHCQEITFHVQSQVNAGLLSLNWEIRWGITSDIEFDMIQHSNARIQTNNGEVVTSSLITTDFRSTGYFSSHTSQLNVTPVEV